MNYSDSLAVIVTERDGSQPFDVEVFYSDADECWVAGVACCECGAKYEEELGTAIAKIRKGQDLFCIKCDDVASSEGQVVSVERERCRVTFEGTLGVTRRCLAFSGQMLCEKCG